MPSLLRDNIAERDWEQHQGLGWNNMCLDLETATHAVQRKMTIEKNGGRPVSRLGSHITLLIFCIIIYL